MKRPRVALASGATILSLLVLAPVAAARQVLVHEDDEFHNSAFVRTSDDVDRDLFAGDVKAEQQDWSAALGAYQAILDRGDDAVVAFGPRAYLAASDVARRRIAALPEAALERYRALFSERAAQMLAHAAALHDLEAVLDVARRFPFTASADRALRMGAAMAWERGDPVGLSRAVEELLRRERAGPAEIALYAHALARRGARGELARVRERCAPLRGAEVRVGGRERSLGDVLDELSARASGDLEARPAAALATTPLVVEPLFQMPETERRDAGDDREPDPLGRRFLELPPYAPARAGDFVWLAGRDALYRVPFPPAGAAAAEGRASIERLGWDAAIQVSPERFAISSPSLETAAAGDHLVLAVAESTFPGSIGRRQEHGVVFAIDAGGDAGEPLTRDAIAPWVMRTGRPESLQGYVFAGPPARAGDLVVVAGSRLAQATECALFAFDAASGRLRWTRFLASASQVLAYEKRNQIVEQERVAPQPPVVADGVVYCVTNVGMVAAVDARSGAIRWLFKYNRIQPDDGRFRRVATYDTGGWRHSTPHLLGDRLIVAPEDSRFLYVLQRTPTAEGHLVRNDPVFKAHRETLLAVDADREVLLFAAREVTGPRRADLYIEACNLDGALLWRTPPFEGEETITGRPLIVRGEDGRDALMVPVDDALWRLDLARDGLVFDVVAAPAGIPRERGVPVFGNLVATGDAVLSASSGWLLRMSAAP